ncbi:MAG TPA: GNAT family N-acetyltransferase [Williamwhitmania sp.]|nr:GNAT family N-acetyltransferase [Williamwhitmania sp.]
MRPIQYTKLEWDSSFFGYPIGKLDDDAISHDSILNLIKEEHEKGTKLIYWFVNPSNHALLRLANQLKLQPVDIKVTFQKAPVEKKMVSNISSLLHEEISPTILSLALQSGWQSRFKLDSNFINNEFERLYTTWIEKSLNGDLSIDVLGYNTNNEVQGLVTIENKGDSAASIGLIAVDERARGMKIGTKLMDASEQICYKKGIKNLSVATQRSNKQACNFYESLGYTLSDEVNIYHIWLKQ